MPLGRRCANAAVVFVAALASAGGAHAQAGSLEAAPLEAASVEAVPLDAVRTLFARLGPSVDRAALSAASLAILEQGQPLPIDAIDDLDVAAVPWQVVIYADLPLATQGGLAGLADALAAVAGDFTKLAAVRLIAAETTTAETGSATRDPLELTARIDDLRRRERTGELVELRADTTREAATTRDPEDRRRLLLDHFYAEQALREWQQDQFEDVMLGELADHDAETQGPRLLILLRDALDHSPADFVRALAGKPADRLLEDRISDSEPERQRQFSRTLAALGWHSFPWRLAAVPAAPVAAPDEPAARSPDIDLAEATGGRILETTTDLATTVAELGRTVRIRYRSSTSGGGEPEPLDLRPLDPALDLRAPRWTTGVVPSLLALVRARRLLDDDEPGTLPIEAVLIGDLAGSATLEAAVDLGQLPEPASGVPLRSDHLRITVVTERLDRDPEVDRLQGSGLELHEGRWILRAPIKIFDDTDRIVVVVEDLRTGAWGATTAEDAEDSLDDGFPSTVVEVAGRPPPPVAGNLDPKATTAESEGNEKDRRARALIGEPRQPRSPARPTVLQLIAPRGNDLTGDQTFEVLLSLETIARVVFYLDGKEIATDTKKPFSATIDLGAQPREQVVRVVAMSRGDALLGEDSVTVNRPRTRLGITLNELKPVAGTQDVLAEAEVNLPRDAELDRVEFYRNERLVATLTRPPFATRVPGPARVDADFVRVVAVLRDGTEVEDLRLLGAAGAEDRVEVNLVEVYTVVTDAEGKPVAGLAAGDFKVRSGKTEVRIDRFAIADQVPLVLGLAVDSSESMWAIMPDTRKAAARFLSDIVTRIDRAFVVDFDDSPKLVQATTERVFDLIASLSRLEASGATALYDSIVFALNEFEPGLGRKAIVLLTDGDDYGSRFGFGKAQRAAAQSGVPIYFIALGGFGAERPSFRKIDLETIAKDSAGRVFYSSNMDEVVAAYAQIAQELRSQYVLAFTTEHLLSDEEVAKIKVEVDGKGYQVRAVVGRER